MAHWKSLGTASAAVVGLFALSSSASAQYVVDNSKIPSGPGINSRSENIDFGDIDLDGDWDMAVADGGDLNQDQNRCWVNDGGLQGGTLGVYSDETAARFPSFNDQSRDIEFADIENDGDLDIYSSNTAQIIIQGNRWWVNDGGDQGGTLGFFTDDTANRWVGLGGAGSSLPASEVITTGIHAGTFRDWSCDCDFGDLDNDGDLDLFHSSYGGAFGGQVPSRIFLNDGDGKFSEFNPQGATLFGSTISNGTPAIWCDGNQQSNTTNSTGAFADIASSALDIDLGDIDGDFDLDVLHGARQEAPRMFANRLQGSSLAPAVGGGALGFRDVTGAVFPASYTSGSGHYEQEMGDLDFDGDLDIYGLNWKSPFQDLTYENDGTGNFLTGVQLFQSNADDNEGDFVDYDNDGDLDLYVANFSGQDKLYRNDYAGAGYSFTKVSVPGFSATSLDADAADTDGDGDYDIIVAEDNNQANTFLRNVTGTPDTTGPYIPNVEQLEPAVQTASATGDPVRAHVYDNAPYYITWYNPTTLDVTVDGVNLPAIPAMSSQGQIFRGVLPGNLVGSIDYGFTSSDEYGNTGSSAPKSYTGTYGPAFQATYGSGTTGLAGGEPTISALSVPFSNSTLYLATSSGAGAGTLTVLGIGTASAPGVSIPGLLTLNIGGVELFSGSSALDPNGDCVFGLPLPVVTPGVHVYAQFFVLDFTGTELLASSKGLDVTLQ